MSVIKTDKEVRFIQTTSADYAAQTEIISDAIYFLTDTKEIYVGATNYSQVDSSMSDTSVNPVQNKVITNAMAGKLSTSGGVMTGTLTTKGIKLTKNVNYGDTLPSSPVEGQLFFQTATNLVLDMVYPVGSIYMSVNATSPSTLFGGTWEQIQDRFLLAAGNSYSAGATGGEATHKLSVAEMPSHEGHMYSNFDDNSGWAARNGDKNSYYLDKNTATGYLKYEDRPYKIVSGTEIVMQGYNRGGSQSHNNMPPYLAVYMWKRTA